MEAKEEFCPLGFYQNSFEFQFTFMNAGSLNKEPANSLVILKYATEREREQYEKEIRSMKSIFDGIV